jgi:hypothetical protein
MLIFVDQEKGTFDLYEGFMWRKKEGRAWNAKLGAYMKGCVSHKKEIGFSLADTKCRRWDRFV